MSYEDISKLEVIEEKVGIESLGDRDTFMMMLKMYNEQYFKVSMTEIYTAWKEKDGHQMERMSHKAKGGSRQALTHSVSWDA